MPKIPAPRKRTKTCPKPNCVRPLDHPGRCGQLTKAELAALPTSRKKPITDALAEVKKDPKTKEIAEAIPATQKKKCPACGKNYTARPSGLIPPHNDGGEPCSRKAPPPKKPVTAKTKGKKFLCAVLEKDGCGRMIGVMPSGLMAKHIRTDGSPCPGGDLRPGSPLPPSKKKRPLDQKAKPKSRPIHDRNDRSNYHTLPGLTKSQQKADALIEIVSQYGWEGVTRAHEEVVELTLTRGTETIHVYWDAGVCAGEEITYTAEDYTTKLRNVSAIKMRAAVELNTSMAEVKRKMESRYRQDKALREGHKEHVEAQKARKNPAVTLGQTLLKETDEAIAQKIQGKWVGWRNRISGNEETALVTRDVRKIRIMQSGLEKDRVIDIVDPELGYRTFMLTCLLRVQSNAMRRRTNVNEDDDHPSNGRKSKARAKTAT